MKTLNVVILIALLASSAVAQTPGPSRDATVVRTQLLEIEAEIARANRECDYKYFDRIEADEFIFTDASGTVTTKKQDLAGEASCRKSTTLQVLDEVIVQVHGETALLSARSTMGTGAATRRTRFTDVFVWRSGRWQLVAGHSSRIP